MTGRNGTTDDPHTAAEPAVASADLLGSPEFFRDMLNIAADAIIAVDADQRIVLFNLGAEKIFGYTTAEIIGRPLDLLLPPGLGRIHGRYVAKFGQSELASRSMSSRGVLHGRRRDGSLFPAEASILRMAIGGKPIYTAILRDVSGARAAEEAIRKLNAELLEHSGQLEALTRQLMEFSEQALLASRAKNEFLANTSHELRTPLNAIIGFSGMLLSNIFDDHLSPRTIEYLEYINRAGNSLLQIVNDVLDIASLEAGQMDVYPTTVKTANLVDSIVRIIVPRCDVKKLRFTCDVKQAPAALYVDERRIKQCVVNLLSNAVKFTEEKGEISLTISTGADGQLLFKVSDTGIGMDPAGISVAFTLFGQIESALSRQHDGTGLGLPLAKRLAEAHGGQLTIESTTGIGTTVTLALPPSSIAS